MDPMDTFIEDNGELESGDLVKSVEPSCHSSTGEVESRTSSAELAIAQKESKAVLRLRILVILVLLLAAVAVCFVVYYFTKRSQDAEFEAQFKGSAEKVLSSFENIVKEKMGAIGSLCLQLTAQARTGNTTWPFVTMDSFQERAASARTLSKALHMSFLPVVSDENRVAWEAYSVTNVGWLKEARSYESSEGDTSARNRILKMKDRSSMVTTEFRAHDQDTTNSTTNTTSDELNFNAGIGSRIYQFTQYYDTIVDPGPGPYTPVWESSPVTQLDAINMNLLSFPVQGDLVKAAMTTGELVIGGFSTAPPGNSSSSDLLTAWYAGLLSTFAGHDVYYNGDPLAEAAFPIFPEFDGNKTVVGVMTIQYLWASYFENILPPNAKGIVVVLENACDGAFTYQIDGSSVQSIGTGDLHNTKYNYLKQSASFNNLTSIADGTKSGITINHGACPYSMHVYPSTELYDQYNKNTPMIITISIGLIFVFTAIMFIIYDRLVERRQRLVMRTAVLSSAIVSSLFPENVRNRLLESKGAAEDMLAPSHRLKSYLKGGAVQDPQQVKPIADLFPHTTVLFADISGFTAWSSTREPAQVFILLQTVYQAFDVIAKKRQVFKVETIGDSYVAVAGLPNPQPNHAAIMAQFAWECKDKMKQIVRELEITLGPDTADLAMRFGLHSGPVTAGVLLGERARFQLFGDTVNTASRMESTGERNMIQASHTTANLLVVAGKAHWVKPRENAIVAKGKGVLNTFWITPKKHQEDDSSDEDHRQLALHGIQDSTAVLKHTRLIQWMTELLLYRLKQIVARRNTRGRKSTSSKSAQYMTTLVKTNNGTALDEVVEVISMPKFDQKAVTWAQDPSQVVIPDLVVEQLHNYVSIIASAYRNNPFHNFEHACHVTMAVDKFLRRIVAPELDLDKLAGADQRGALASHLHDYTHGINSDPLTLFAIVYSALIHDVDHRGVSNTRLMKEDEQMAVLYKNKSVAEQNSLDISWKLLMSETFADLRLCMFDNDQVEFDRFRQVVVNVVLATDIFDKELNDLRKSRWNKAFDEQNQSGSLRMHGDTTDLKATIVIEHIMQASDVAHTMQHWHIYRKWNERLFTEMYLAYQAGRMEADPLSFWYKGELGFFDNYIIPLAKKLKDCNVFGVSSDECLNYAMQNRAEWEERGEDVIKDMMERLSHMKSEVAPAFESEEMLAPALESEEMLDI